MNRRRLGSPAGRRLLIDTGGRPETVLRNAEELGIDLSSVADIVLTHNHDDHTGGLLTLRRDLSQRNPRALSRVHAGKGIFLSRLDAEGREANGLLRDRPAFEAGGGTNADGSRIRMYCSHYFADGRFTLPDITVAGMQDRVWARLRDMGFPGLLAGFFTRKIPKLVRWK